MCLWFMPKGSWSCYHIIASIICAKNKCIKDKHTSRQGVITNPKSLSHIWKVFRISELTFSDLGARFYTKLHLKMFQICQVTVLDIKFQTSFRTSGEIFGFVMTSSLKGEFCDSNKLLLWNSSKFEHTMCLFTNVLTIMILCNVMVQYCMITTLRYTEIT